MFIQTALGEVINFYSCASLQAGADDSERTALRFGKECKSAVSVTFCCGTSVPIAVYETHAEAVLAVEGFF